MTQTARDIATLEALALQTAKLREEFRDTRLVPLPQVSDYAWLLTSINDASTLVCDQITRTDGARDASRERDSYLYTLTRVAGYLTCAAAQLGQGFTHLGYLHLAVHEPDTPARGERCATSTRQLHEAVRSSVQSLNLAHTALSFEARQLAHKHQPDKPAQGKPPAPATALGSGPAATRAARGRG